MRGAPTLDEVLKADVDDIARSAQRLSTSQSWQLLRQAADRSSRVEEPIDRFKAAWLVQVILAEAEDAEVPTATSEYVAKALAPLLSSPEAARSALTSLALLWLRSRELSAELEKSIRKVFVESLSAKDPALRASAKNALAKGGVLSRRVSPRAEATGQVALKARA